MIFFFKRCPQTRESKKKKKVKRTKKEKEPLEGKKRYKYHLYNKIMGRKKGTTKEVFERDLRNDIN